jgi:hypothetical protein
VVKADGGVEVGVAVGVAVEVGVRVGVLVGVGAIGTPGSPPVAMTLVKTQTAPRVSPWPSGVAVNVMLPLITGPTLKPTLSEQSTPNSSQGRTWVSEIVIVWPSLRLSGMP